MAGRLRVTLRKSTVGTTPAARGTVRALGLRPHRRHGRARATTPSPAGRCAPSATSSTVEEVAAEGTAKAHQDAKSRGDDVVKLHDLRPAPGSTKRAHAGRSRHRRRQGQDRRPRHQGPEGPRAVPRSRPGSRAARRPSTSASPSCAASSAIGRIEYQVVNVGRISAYARGRPLRRAADAEVALHRQPRDPARRRASSPRERSRSRSSATATSSVPALRARGRVHRQRPQQDRGRRRLGPVARPEPPSRRSRRAERAAEPRPSRPSAGEAERAEARDGPDGRGPAGDGSREPRRDGHAEPDGRRRAEVATAEAGSDDRDDRRRRPATPPRDRLTVFDALVNAFRAPDIRRRILFVLGMLVIVRVLAHVPVPGVDRDALEDGHRRNSVPAAAEPVLRRRPRDLLDHRPGREPVHQRLDHHAADDRGRAPAPAAPARGRVRAQQDQPVHALPDGAHGASCRPTATWHPAGQHPGPRAAGHPELRPRRASRRSPDRRR